MVYEVNIPSHNIVWLKKKAVAQNVQNYRNKEGVLKIHASAPKMHMIIHFSLQKITQKEYQKSKLHQNTMM